MADSSPDATEFLDTLDPNNYVIGVVHFPPECDAKDLFISTSHKRLKKYFKKLAKHPEKKRRKVIPASEVTRNFELISEGPSSLSRMPFLGESSQGGHCLRLLSFHLLQFQPSNSIDDSHDVTGDDQETHETETEEASSQKRSRPDDLDVSKDVQPGKKRKTLNEES
ncbi:unnamed protein product [Rodentolepis nana]|uniref:Mediator of RNA polymerase II transcription subunit 19 n=1 Tax=Rodentolepis nana TaxID=102285 RepID=A0A0R3TRA5_RODNA|nr:unnamed protein product [Rodentolepis nana]